MKKVSLRTKGNTCLWNASKNKKTLPNFLLCITFLLMEFKKEFTEVYHIERLGKIINKMCLCFFQYLK